MKQHCTETQKNRKETNTVLPSDRILNIINAYYTTKSYIYHEIYKYVIAGEALSYRYYEIRKWNQKIR